MTHASIRRAEAIDPDCTFIDRYDSNNGIVLKTNDFREDVLIFLDGNDLGIDKESPLDLIVQRATPIFKVIIEVHNNAVRLAHAAGRAEKTSEIKRVLEI